LRDECGLDLPFDDWIARKYEHYFPLVADLKPRPGAIEIYQELRMRGIPQAVVSNSDRLIVDANLRAVGLLHPGMRTVSRNDVRQGKPHAEPFLRAAWLVQVDPADAVAIDDSVTGVTAGLAAGMRTIFWPERPGMKGPEGALVANDADELRALLGLNEAFPLPSNRGRMPDEIQAPAPAGRAAASEQEEEPQPPQGRRRGRSRCHAPQDRNGRQATHQAASQCPSSRSRHRSSAPWCHEARAACRRRLPALHRRSGTVPQRPGRRPQGKRPVRRWDRRDR